MRFFQYCRQPPCRTVLLLAGVLGLISLVYLLWSPGTIILDGRHDLRTNGIWMQHGWLGDDAWFARYKKEASLFRSQAALTATTTLLYEHNIQFVYPHLCPCQPDGTAAAADPVQTERFLDAFAAFSVLPWVGGVLGIHCFPDSAAWRKRFIASTVALLRAHPRLAGLHINIEPLPSGTQAFLVLLEELRAALPPGKLLSVAAYPPPTWLHPHPQVHWDKAYFRAVAARSDQMAVMMYDTGLRIPKLYEQLMADWTVKVLAWGEKSSILLGVPSYSDAGVGYHHPQVENIRHALLGIHAGLAEQAELPENYAGIALYCAWETDAAEWRYLRRHFEKQERTSETGN